ncbi:hypothetical protein E2C01_080875 [Portunus trituberculatus]|uniref:Uncharacterized protein n=1 Tax=Portunus trituberculatus TaxID=210409 RepID=A0A5B7IUJ8_PORTR|nr:hypothetical protein [Portunus trituberculatus]
MKTTKPAAAHRTRHRIHSTQCQAADSVVTATETALSCSQSAADVMRGHAMVGLILAADSVAWRAAGRRSRDQSPAAVTCPLPLRPGLCHYDQLPATIKSLLAIAICPLPLPWPTSLTCSLAPRASSTTINLCLWRPRSRGRREARRSDIGAGVGRHAGNTSVINQ